MHDLEVTRLVSGSLAVTHRSVYRLHCIFLCYLNGKSSLSFFDKQASDNVKCFRVLPDSDVNILTMAEEAAFPKKEFCSKTTEYLVKTSKFRYIIQLYDFIEIVKLVFLVIQENLIENLFVEI